MKYCPFQAESKSSWHQGRCSPLRLVLCQWLSTGLYGQQVEHSAAVRSSLTSEGGYPMLLAHSSFYPCHTCSIVSPLYKHRWLKTETGWHLLSSSLVGINMQFRAPQCPLPKVQQQDLFPFLFQFVQPKLKLLIHKPTLSPLPRSLYLYHKLLFSLCSVEAQVCSWSIAHGGSGGWHHGASPHTSSTSWLNYELSWRIFLSLSVRHGLKETSSHEVTDVIRRKWVPAAW